MVSGGDTSPVRSEDSDSIPVASLARSLARGAGWGCSEPASNPHMKPSAEKAGGTGKAPPIRVE